MILHLVQFRLRPGVAHDDVRVRSLHQSMLALRECVPGIIDWRCGFNVTPDAAAWDYAVSASFADRERLHAYFEHPAHVALLGPWQEVAELAFVDLEF